MEDKAFELEEGEGGILPFTTLELSAAWLCHPNSTATSPTVAGRVSISVKRGGRL